MVDTGESELFQVYLKAAVVNDADGLTERVNETLRAVADAGGKIVEHNVDIVTPGPFLVARIVYTLPHGATLAKG